MQFLIDSAVAGLVFGLCVRLMFSAVRR